MLGGSSHDRRLDVFIASLYMLVHVVWIRFALRGDATSILHVLYAMICCITVTASVLFTLATLVFNL